MRATKDHGTLFSAIKERQVGRSLKMLMIGQCLSNVGACGGGWGDGWIGSGHLDGRGAEGLTFSSVDVSRLKVLALQIWPKKRALVFYRRLVLLSLISLVSETTRCESVDFIQTIDHQDKNVSAFMCEG